MLTNDQIGGIVRAVAAAAAGYAVTKGWTDRQTATWAVGGVVLLATGAWSWWTNRPQKIVNSATGQPKAN